MSEDEAVPEYKPSNSRDVPEWLVAGVLEKLAKLNARAAKLGVDGFTITKGEVFERKVRRHDADRDYVERMVTITVEGPKVKLAGWDLVGRVDFEDGAILVNARPDREMPVRYRSTTTFCEHCKSDRKRNAVFVFRADDDGHYLQVGRSCLKDFMGVDPTAALWALSAYGVLFEEIDEEMRGGGREHYRVPVSEVMQAAAQSVRESGFMSKAAADKIELNGGVAFTTSSDVSNLLFDPKVYEKDSRGRGRERPTEAEAAADLAKGDAVVAWVLETWGPKVDKSDYEYNAVELLGHDSVSPKRIGLLVSLVGAYNREHEEQEKRAKLVNAWVGEIKQRRVFDATYLGCNSFDGNFGTFWIGRFSTPEGLVVYKGNSPFWNTGANAGEPIRFKGTITKHDDYKGFKQTMVSRCEIFEGEEKPAKVKRAKKASNDEAAPAALCVAC